MFYLIFIFVFNVLSIVFYLFGTVLKYIAKVLLALSVYLTPTENWRDVPKEVRKLIRLTYSK